MKIRNDFVSNSSSSSYVVAIDFGKYDFELFVKKTLDKCHSVPGKSTQDDIRRTNEAVLRFGMLHECLYIGNPTVGRTKEIWKRGEKYDHTMVKNGESDEYTPFKELTDDHRILGSGDIVRRVDENTVEYEYDDELPAWMCVPRDVMRDGIRNGGRYINAGKPLRGNSAKARAARIVEYVRQKIRERIKHPELNVFCITANTVKNTRDMMKAGYEISFNSPIAVSNELLSEFLDRIEFRIKSGETFVFAVAGDSGESQSDNRLYMPDGYSNPFEYTPAQDVTREFIEI